MDTKDDKGYSFGSIFLPNAFPEGMEQFKVTPTKEGAGYIIDVIPFYAGKQHPLKPEGRLAYLVDLWVHRMGDAHLVCQMKTGGWKEPDSICTYAKVNNLSTDQWKKLNSKRRCVYFVWDHTTPEEEAKGLKWWEVSHFFFEKNVDEISKNPRGGGAIAWSHHDHGKSVAFTAKVTGQWTDGQGNKQDSHEYTGFQFVDRFEPAIPDKILEQTFALDETINMHPTDDEWEKGFPEGVAQANAPVSVQNDSKFGRGNGENIPTKTMETPEPKTETPKCPVEGLAFGVNAGESKDCRTCDVFDPCFDAKNAGAKDAPAETPAPDPPPEAEKVNAAAEEKKEEKKTAAPRRRPKLQPRRKQ